MHVFFIPFSNKHEMTLAPSGSQFLIDEEIYTEVGFTEPYIFSYPELNLSISSATGMGMLFVSDNQLNLNSNFMASQYLHSGTTYYNITYTQIYGYGDLNSGLCYGSTEYAGLRTQTICEFSPTNKAKFKTYGTIIIGNALNYLTYGYLHKINAEMFRSSDRDILAKSRYNFDVNAIRINEKNNIIWTGIKGTSILQSGSFSYSELDETTMNKLKTMWIDSNSQPIWYHNTLTNEFIFCKLGALSIETTSAGLYKLDFKYEEISR